MLAAWTAVMPMVYNGLAETAEEAAARQEAADNYRRINARVDDLFAAVESMQKRFNALQDDVRKLSEEVSRASDRTKDSATQETLKQLAKAIEEVDRKRVSDRDRLLDAFAGLEKNIASLGTAKPNASPPKPAKPRAHSPKNGGAAPPAIPEKGYEYTVLEGDTLSKIVAALNKQDVKVTLKQIQEANPSINWSRLQIGQKIFIPAP
jgi:LysM repeat protein